jgi:hypothetical protein
MLGNCSTVSKLFSAVVKLFLRVCSCASQVAGSPSAVLTGPRFARNAASLTGQDSAPWVQTRSAAP